MITADLDIVSLSQLNALAVRQYGAKASNLAELSAIGVRVPPGIAVGKNVLAYFLRENGLDLEALERIHTMGMVFLEAALVEAQEYQTRIVQLIAEAPFPVDLEEQLKAAISELGTDAVAVRSSCVLEDSASTSFAGQYVTVLGVSGWPAIVQAIRACWASQYDGRVLKYALARRGMPVLIPSMGVLIQQMLRPDFAGVCFTEGPTPKTRSLTIVESVAGCGDALVSGTTTPSHFEADRDGSVQVRRIPHSATAPPDSMVQAVISLSRRIADHFGCPQDTEWAAIEDNVFILQARPITVVGGGRNHVPIGVSGRSSGFKSAASNESPLVLLRDDLHEWLISQVDPLAYRAASYLLGSQRDDGGWRIDGHPEWDSVATAMVVQLLLDGGVPSTLRWAVPRAGGQVATVGIPSAITWLAKNANPTGTWGTDLWDTCQVLRALHRCGIPASEPLFRKALDFVSDELIQGQAGRQSGQEWFGAGFFAVALRLFTELRLEEDASACKTLLLGLQSPEGDFCGVTNEGHRVPSEWHTAQCVSALRLQVAADSSSIAVIGGACDWLARRQHPNGSWGVTDGPYSHYNTFFTAYAILALADASPNYSDNVARAMRWLRGKQTASGSFGDLGSSLMAVAAWQHINGPMFTVSLPIPIFLRIQATLST